MLQTVNFVYKIAANLTCVLSSSFLLKCRLFSKKRELYEFIGVQH